MEVDVIGSWKVQVLNPKVDAMEGVLSEQAIAVELSWKIAKLALPASGKQQSINARKIYSQSGVNSYSMKYLADR